MKAKNNPKNRRKLLEHQRRQLELSNITEKEAKQRRIHSNLDTWVNSLPKTLKAAVPEKLHKLTIEKIRKTPLKPPHDKHIIISAEEITASKFVAYTILYALIQGGITTPSEIRTTSLLDGYNNINGIFSARKWKEYFFSHDAKVLLVEGGSKSLTLLSSKGEDQFWRELIEFTRNNDKLVIITYATDEKERSKDIFIPSLTGEAELNYRLIKKSVFIPLTEEEEKEIRSEQEKVYRSI